MNGIKESTIVLNIIGMCNSLNWGVFIGIFISLVAGCGSASSGLPNLTVADFKDLQQTKNKIELKEKEALTYYSALMEAANEVLFKGPFSVVHKSATPPSGSKHDYMTWAPYFWPNPDTPDGLPYIRKDGEINPDTRNSHTDFEEKDQFFEALDVLGKAYYFSGDKKYAYKAQALIRVWFLDSETAMNPHLNYGQGIPGQVEGRAFGIIEFGGIRNVLATLEILQWGNVLDTQTNERFLKWLNTYSHWLQTSEIGQMEATRGNNHGTTYDLQLCNILIYLGETEQIRNHLENVTKKRITQQIEADGRQPHELARTKSFSYSVMNLKVFTKLAVLAKKLEVDLWNYESNEGAGIKKAFEFLMPYLETEKEWKYTQITNLKDQKIQFAKLLEYAGKEFGEEEYLAIAKKYK